MANIIVKQLKTFFGRIPFVPKTQTNAVYDGETGERLDNTLAGMDKHIFQMAKENAILSNAQYVVIEEPANPINNPSIVLVDATTNMPSDCAWGIREISIINPNMIVARITGVTADGQNGKIWTSCYNYGTWTPWMNNTALYLHDSNDTYGVNASATIMNGDCTVRIEQYGSGIPNNSSIELLSNIPKPKTAQYANAVCVLDSGKISYCILQLLPNGEFWVGQRQYPESNIMITQVSFSYPI